MPGLVVVCLEKINKRIWELDFIRGFCILLMIVDHALYDLAYIFGIQWARAFFSWPVRSVAWWVAVFCFVAISGISSTLSRSNLKRGLQLAGVALALTLATALMDKIAGQSDVFIIRFGILHMLAVCMLVYPLLKNMSTALRTTLGLGLAAIGIYFVNSPLKAAGYLAGALVKSKGAFYSSDYFPLLPWLGFFIIGSVIGVTLYKNRKSLISEPKPSKVKTIVEFAGKYSLFFYVLHQPVIYGILTLFFTVWKLAV